MKKNIIMICLGLIILTIGIPLLIYADLGVDPLSSFYEGLSKITKISYGWILIFFNIIYVIVNFIKYKNIRFCIVGMIMAFIMGRVIDLINEYLISYIPNDYLIQQILIFLVGFIFLALGVALIQAGKVQKMPFEGFQQVIADIKGKDINVIRVYVEIALVVLALIVFLILIIFIDKEVDIFDTLNIGTLFIMLLTGPTVNVMYKKLTKGE